jgi:UDP-N-acetylenolpyruvoylglucosamine reductase
METKIKGRRELNEHEIGIINEITASASSVEYLIDKVQDTVSADKAWISKATEQLQQGFMSLVRAVEKPDTF